MPVSRASKPVSPMCTPGFARDGKGVDKLASIQINLILVSFPHINTFVVNVKRFYVNLNVIWYD